MSTDRLEKYIEIREAGLSDTGKTAIWEVMNIRDSTLCGEVRWYGGFRKYCFYPADDSMLYDSDFLRLVADHLDKVNREHGENLKSKV